MTFKYLHFNNIEINLENYESWNIHTSSILFN